jgi:UDPglucose--hexose-1-phosphate uridylyltransferase
LKVETMPSDSLSPLRFERRFAVARIVEPSGRPVQRRIEIRTHPLTGRTCRIAYSRSNEKEAGAERLPEPPPQAEDTDACPFCRPQLADRTPRLHPDLFPNQRMTCGESVLFPNLFPYGSFSAVSLFDNRHFVEIGTASPASYADSFRNCRNYLQRVLAVDPQAAYTAVTQNHLPSAGGSLVHPHLQVNADRIPANHQRFLSEHANRFYRDTGDYLFSAYLAHEATDGSRLIGRAGSWQWLAAYAPEGFFEIWGICPGVTAIGEVSEADWAALASGIINVQRYYRSIYRNGYNLGLLTVEAPASRLELRVVCVVRSNYAPWVRNDYTGFEVMLGDMTTFTAPEDIARAARAFFAD